MSAMGWCFSCSPALLRAFTSDEAVVELGTLFLKIVASCRFRSHSPWWWPALCGGAGDTRFVMIATMIGMWGVRIPLAIVAGYWLSMGVLYVWLAMIADWTVRMALMLWRHRSERWRSIQVLRSSPT